MHKRVIIRRTVWVALSLAVIAATGLALGRPIWQRRQLDRRVARLVADLERRDEPAIDAALLTALEGNPRYTRELQLFLGTRLLQSGEPAGALKAYSPLKPEGRLRVPLLLHVGQALYKTGQLSKAQRIFREVEFEKPGVASAHRWLVTIYHDLGAMQSAFAELEIVAKLEPDDYFAYRLMGLMYLEDFQKPQEAVDEYRKALARHPPAEQAQAIRIEIARALLFLNDYHGVLEVLEGAEKNAHVLGLQADCRWSMSETQEAARLLEQARSLDPDERIVLYLTGRFALEEGRPQAALAPLKLLLQRDPHDAQTRYQLSQAYRQLGDQTAAKAELDRMNESKALTEKMGPMFEQAMLRPQDDAIREELADLCDQLGKHELARVWRRAASQVRQSGGASGPAR
jgi:tetratricopeptide (TPR) repeat protein